MIVTVTMNPSMDYAYFTDHFSLGKTNRFENPTKSVGGKGINAGRAAALSGSNVLLTGFLAGDNGGLVEKHLKEERLFELHMLPTSGETRNAITLMHDGNTQTEIVEAGPVITEENVDEILKLISHTHKTKKVNLICISGSANTENVHLYQNMLEYIKKYIDPGIPVFMDISGDQLRVLLQEGDSKPSFIKPNIHELGEVLAKSIQTKEEAITELRAPIFNGIETILISWGDEGALCKSGNQFYDIQIPKINITNTTGSGDATVGGFAYAYENKYPLEEALKYAMACGMSNAQHGEVGVINRDDVSSFMKNINVRKM